MVHLITEYSGLWCIATMWWKKGGENTEICHFTKSFKKNPSLDIWKVSLQARVKFTACKQADQLKSLWDTV